MDILPLNSDKLFPDPLKTPPVHKTEAIPQAKEKKKEPDQEKKKREEREEEQNPPPDPSGILGGKIDVIAK